jgi:pimeloyl-ACP methyl ester carboxylesterase
MSLARPTTPAIKDENNRVVAGSIASLETVDLGGWKQAILIRGRDTTMPVLLFLHGGPGMPMMYLAHAFQRELENHFLCVQWDQRGAGKSFSENVPVETMNVEQFISDAHDLVRILRKRFNKEKVYLAGHSWGSYLGILLAKRHPELFSAYIGIGQIVDVQKAREITGAYLRMHARELGNQEALRDLEANGRNAHETWLFTFGNELYGKTSWMPLLVAGLFSPEYTFHDAMNIAKGPQFSGK